MSDLQDAAVASGGVDQRGGRRQVGRDRLFDQDVDTGLEQPAADLFVGGGGDGDDGGIHFAGQVAGIGERLRADLSGGGSRRAPRVDITIAANAARVDSWITRQ